MAVPYRTPHPNVARGERVVQGSPKERTLEQVCSGRTLSAPLGVAQGTSRANGGLRTKRGSPFPVPSPGLQGTGKGTGKGDPVEGGGGAPRERLYILYNI